MDLEPFFDQKVNILNISLDINNCKNSNLIFKSQHLVMNPGQGPALKCAPGHDSIKDSSIIKSYWSKSGVMDKQNIKTVIWDIWGWGLLMGIILLDGSVLRGTPQNRAVQQNDSHQKPPSPNVPNYSFDILFIHNSTFGPVTFDDTRIFDTVVTWSTF